MQFIEIDEYESIKYGNLIYNTDISELKQKFKQRNLYFFSNMLTY